MRLPGLQKKIYIICMSVFLRCYTVHSSLSSIGRFVGWIWDVLNIFIFYTDSIWLGLRCVAVFNVQKWNLNRLHIKCWLSQQADLVKRRFYTVIQWAENPVLTVINWRTVWISKCDDGRWQWKGNQKSLSHTSRCTIWCKTNNSLYIFWRCECGRGRWDGIGARSS